MYVHFAKCNVILNTTCTHVPTIYIVLVSHLARLPELDSSIRMNVAGILPSKHQVRHCAFKMRHYNVIWSGQRVKSECCKTNILLSHHSSTISMEFSAEMQSICLSLSNAALILLLQTFSLFLKTLVFYVIFSSSVGFCKLRTLVQL